MKTSENPKYVFFVLALRDEQEPVKITDQTPSVWLFLCPAKNNFCPIVVNLCQTIFICSTAHFLRVETEGSTSLSTCSQKMKPYISYIIQNMSICLEAVCDYLIYIYTYIYVRAYVYIYIYIYICVYVYTWFITFIHTSGL